MDWTTKVAYIALGLDILIIFGLIIWVSHFVYLDMFFDNLNREFKTLIDNKDYVNLKARCDELIDSTKNVEKFSAQYGLALVEINDKNYDKAIEHLEKSIEIIPSISMPYYKLIEIMLYRKEVFRAHYYVIQALNNNILFDSTFFTYLGMLFISSENYQEAIKIFEIASNKDSSSPTPIIGIAIAHYLNKNNNMAIDFIREARKKINPNKSSHSEVNEWAKGLLAIIHGDLKEGNYIFEYYKDSSNFGPVFELILDRIKQVLPQS